jgi:sulfate transport system permease protein
MPLPEVLQPANRLRQLPGEAGEPGASATGGRHPAANAAGSPGSAKDPLWVRVTLTAAALLVLTVLIVVPVVNVFVQAFGKGIGAYVRAIVGNPHSLHAIGLTLTVAPLAVLLNLVFGVAAAWCLARFRFPGRSLLLALIDLPFSVSPVVAGLIFVLIFGLQGWLGPWLQQHGINVLFGLPGLVLATAFVTFPFVARELLPVMEAVGPDEEVAALSLGASGWQMFWRITLPNVRWGLLYGVILCNARAMGEFGAVYVVSGRIPGQTLTIPLQVEKLFQDYHSAESFALASILTLLALITLAVKTWLERKVQAVRREGRHPGEPAA